MLVVFCKMIMASYSVVKEANNQHEH